MPLSFLVIGAGAIGGYIGGSLALAGSQVAFLCRKQLAAHLRSNGLQLNLPGQSETISPIVVEAIPEAFATAQFDAVILAVKAYDTTQAVQPLVAFGAKTPPIICLQNGVDNEPMLAGWFGEDKVIAGTVTTSVARPAPGVIRVERLRGVALAGGNAQENLTKQILEEMNRAGLNTHFIPSEMDLKWSKMLTNLAGNASCAILDMPPGEVLAHPRLVRVEIEQQREALRVMKGLGARAIPLPGTPVHLFAFAIRYLPTRLLQPVLIRVIGRGRGGKMPSLHLDLHGGARKSEVEALNGAVAAHGSRLGISTPVNRKLNETLLALVNREIPLNAFRLQPDKFLETVFPPGLVKR